MSRSPSTEPVAFGLGSNLGDREAQLREAIGALRARCGALQIASLYESEALPRPDPSRSGEADPPFLNTAVVAREIERPDPDRLLEIAQAIERAAGRQVAPRWAPRVLDVDLLLVGVQVVRRPDLTLPHAEMARRRFVLMPLAEIAPDLPVPVEDPDRTFRTVAELDRKLASRETNPPPKRRVWSLPPTV